MVLLVAAADLGAQSYDLRRDVVAAGGGRSSGGTFVLRATVGQPEATSAAASGGTFRLRGGFWSGLAESRPDALFADGFEAP